MWTAFRGSTFRCGTRSGTLAGSVTVAYTAGSGDIDMAAALAGLGSLQVDWIASVFDTPSCRVVIDNVLADNWGPLKQRYGLAVYAQQAAFGDLAALGAASNTFRAIQAGEYDSPSPKWEILAQFAADLAQYWDLGAALTEAQVLARPPTGRVLRNVKPPRSGRTSFDDSERNALYFDGVAALDRQRGRPGHDRARAHHVPGPMPTGSTTRTSSGRTIR